MLCGELCDDGEQPESIQAEIEVVQVLTKAEGVLVFRLSQKSQKNRGQRLRCLLRTRLFRPSLQPVCLGIPTTERVDCCPVLGVVLRFDRTVERFVEEGETVERVEPLIDRAEYGTKGIQCCTVMRLSIPFFAPLLPTAF